MKKIVVGLLATIMMAAGLVVGSGVSAVAQGCPYGGCPTAYTYIDAPDRVVRDHRATICVKMGSQGNAEQPRGKITLRVTRAEGGYRLLRVEHYPGHEICFRTTKLRKLGDYLIKATFDRKPGTRWHDSDNHAEFRVVKHR